MKAVVTGCAGFIGSHLTDKLIELGHEVVGIDNLSNGKSENVNTKCKFKKEDIRSLHIQDLFEGADVVFHQAAIGSVPRSLKWPDDTYQANIDGFRNILRICETLEIPKLVYASSSSVYGDNKTLPKVESEIGKQLSPYSASKRVNELMSEVSPVTCVGLRYFNVYGPRQTPDSVYSAVIPKWIKGLMNREEITFHGDGTATRDFTFVDDVVKANLLAAKYEQTDVFNIGTGRYTILNDLLVYIRKALKLRHDEVRFYRDRENPPPIRSSIADISKAKRDLGYHPYVFIEEGISRTVESFAEVKLPVGVGA